MSFTCRLRLNALVIAPQGKFKFDLFGLELCIECGTVDGPRFSFSFWTWILRIGEVRKWSCFLWCDRIIHWMHALDIWWSLNEKSRRVLLFSRHYQEDKYKMKFRTCIKVAKHNMNLLKNSESTICFFSGKAPGQIQLA